MTKKALSILVLTVVLSMLLCISAFPAMRGSKASKVSSYAVWQNQVKQAEQPNVYQTIEEFDARGTARADRLKMAMGKAVRMAGQGIGTRVEETWDDLQFQYTYDSFPFGVKRYIGVADVDMGGGNTAVDVHFQFSMLGNDDSVNYFGTGYQEYAASESSDNWIFNDQLGGYRLQPSLTKGARDGGLDITADGLAVLACVDNEGEFVATPDSGLDVDVYWQTAQYDFPTTHNWPWRADFNAVAPGAFWQYYPQLAVSQVGGQTIAHCAMYAGENINDPSGLGYLRRIVYFKNTTGSDPNGWRDPTVACSVNGLADYGFGVDRKGVKVCVLYGRWTSTGIVEENGFDWDLWMAESDTGASWTRTNITNYGPTRNQISYTLDFNWQHSAMYDVNHNLHVLFTAKPVPAQPYRTPWVWGYLDQDLLHYSPLTGISKVADATYDAFADVPTQGTWNGNMCGYINDALYTWMGEPRMSQCGNYLYATWSQIGSKVLDLTGSSTSTDSLEAVSDCSNMDVGFKKGGNGELFVAVSSDLTGLLWDAPRNLTNTFTPDCDHPDSGGTLCGNEQGPMLSPDAIDVTGRVPALHWPPDLTNEVIPKTKTGGYTFTSNKYLMVQYVDDLIPGNYIGRDSASPATNYPTDIRWFRMACVEPEGAPDVEVDPERFVWPLYVEGNGPEEFTVTLTNSGNLNAVCSMTITQIDPVLPAWLDVDPGPITILAGVSNTATITITVTPPMLAEPQFLEGIVHVNCNDPDEPVQDIVIHLWWGPEVEEPGVYDTVATSKASEDPDDFLVLIASNHGEQGQQGAGEANLDFVASGTDCDPAATVYLYSSSPFVMIKDGGNPSITTSHYSTNVGSGFTWTPLTAPTLSKGVGNTNDVDYEWLFTGRMANRDSTVWMERTFYAPRKSATLPNFVAVKTVLGCDADVTDSIAVGEVTDWDVPSVAIGAISAPNTSATTQPADAEQFVFFQGTGIGCMDNTRRYATNAFMMEYDESEDPANAGTEFWGSWGASTRDWLDFDAGTNEPLLTWWTELNDRTGLWGDPSLIDQGQFLTYEFRDGLTAGNDRVYWTVYVVGYDMNNYVTLVQDVTKAKEWVKKLLGIGGCCVGLRGNVDNDPDDIVSLGDLTALIDILFISLVDPICMEEADVDGTPPISLGDLTALIDVLFISLNDPLPCP